MGEPATPKAGPRAKLRALLKTARAIPSPTPEQVAEFGQGLHRWARIPLAKYQFDEIGKVLASVGGAWRFGAEVRFLQAQCDLWAGRKERAVLRAEALHRMKPGELRFALLRAHAALNSGDAHLAEHAYAQALSLAPARSDLIEERAAVHAIRQWEEQIRVPEPPKHRLVVATALKNEADDILEWLCFHHVVGVEHFHLYLNDCTDGTLAQIERFCHPEAITIHRVPGDLGQRRANLHFIEKYRHSTRWCAFIDADEFLVPTQDDSVTQVIERLARSGASAVAVNWLNFGSSGHESRPDGLCIDSFTRRAPDDADLHRLIKSICRPNRIVRYLQPHHSVMFGHWVLPDGSPVYPVDGRVASRTDSGLVLNHYCTKSRNQMLAKRARGRPLAADDDRRIRDMSFFADRDRNEVQDLRIRRFAARTRALLSRCGTPK